MAEKLPQGDEGESLSDTELDHVLDAANEELLHHIRRTTDPDAVRQAILESHPEEGPQSQQGEE